MLSTSALASRARIVLQFLTGVRDCNRLFDSASMGLYLIYFLGAPSVPSATLLYLSGRSRQHLFVLAHCDRAMPTSALYGRSLLFKQRELAQARHAGLVWRPLHQTLCIGRTFQAPALTCL